MTVYRFVLMLALAAALGGCGGGSSAPSSSGGTGSGGGSTATFTRTNWATVQSNPDSYKGARADFVGQVFTDPERDAKGTYLQVYVDPKNSDWTTIVAVSDPNLQVAAQDFVHVVGVIHGKYTGKTVLGVSVTDPVVIASS